VTVFAASVFRDLPRIWLACLRRSLPPDDVRFKVFDDSAEGTLDEKLLPDVTLLRRSEERQDSEVAYGDALRRATTPFLAFVDTDVFWLSRDVWPRAMKEFESPRIAGVSGVSRASAASPGTFAIVMLLAGWVGEETLLEMAVMNPYFRRGCLGGLALAGVHDASFVDGPRFGLPLPAALLWRSLLLHPRTFSSAVRDFVEFQEGGKRIRRFLGSPQRAARRSA